MTAVAGAVYTAAQFNTFVRDNLLETAPAKAATSGGYFVTTATNQIGERSVQQGFIPTSDTCSATSYGDCDNGIGPLITAFTGSQALVVVGGRIGGGTVSTQSVKMSWQVDGGTSISASDQWAAGAVGLGSSGFAYDSRAFLATGLTPGLNTFTAKYAVSSGQGSYSVRTILVMPF
jgi:hypothetical protein